MLHLHHTDRRFILAEVQWNKLFFQCYFFHWLELIFCKQIQDVIKTYFTSENEQKKKLII